MGLVTLLTDFGEADTYVGQMKGALLSIAPQTRWVDLTHRVPAQDVAAGAFLLWTAVEAFPAGTVHLAVVDPGVGSERRAVAARSGAGHLFVGPDNGLLVPALELLGGVAEAVELTEPAFWGPRRSSTFHGRDLFAPVAAHLASGVALERVGRPLERLSRPFSFPAPVPEGEALRGEVIHVDGYGNLVSNLPASLLPRRFDVRVGEVEIHGGPHPHYQAVPPGGLLALLGSSGLLEISERDGNASKVLGVRRGAAIVVTAR
ncbi:MAG TPA: SAM-dependent chlorinase/fluorinase [Myxococcaceae bacterium]|nr:SAM-dependent chlorinase/fluorinase [Myxococcaceae bacterium]